MKNKSDKDYNAPGFMVRATARGYYGVAMREPGDVFKIQYARHFADANDKELNGLGWMERLDGKKPSRQMSHADMEARGAKPPPPDPEERDQRMSAIDEMAERTMAAEAKAAKTAEEADVI